jgi:hypothetical protein
MPSHSGTSTKPPATKAPKKAPSSRASPARPLPAVFPRAKKGTPRGLVGRQAVLASDGAPGDDGRELAGDDELL